MRDARKSLGQVALGSVSKGTKHNGQQVGSVPESNLVMIKFGRYDLSARKQSLSIAFEYKQLKRETYLNIYIT